MDELPCEGEDEKKTGKEDVKQAAVQRLCEAEWPKTAVLNIATALRDVSVSKGLKAEFIHKIRRYARGLMALVQHL